ncbi:uncharacterized protein LOC128766333 [Synchiropus splendidus]|uniref:uncharacterized protein LOC128766333 n=1 Tax=Synchiropus splendidus TaxID=270530 RepID=UPI00237EC003|nr:uncharacterized protein LOC128766333 [Synchiropus splendidus]
MLYRLSYPGSDTQPGSLAQKRFSAQVCTLTTVGMDFLAHSFAKTSNKDKIEELQSAVDQGNWKLKHLQERRRRTQEELNEISKETKQRVNLILDKMEVVDVLQQLGLLLQEEKDLAVQLNIQSCHKNTDLLERNEQVVNKVKSLTAEIAEVKQQLTKAKDVSVAATPSLKEDAVNWLLTTIHELTTVAVNIRPGQMNWSIQSENFTNNVTFQLNQNVCNFALLTTISETPSLRGCLSALTKTS